VTDRATVETLAEALRGRRTGVSYHDLARILKQAEAEHVSSAGSHRTWKHEAIRDHLTLVEKGSGDVLPVYISKTRKYLLSIAAAL